MDSLVAFKKKLTPQDILYMRVNMTNNLVNIDIVRIVIKS